MLVYSGLEQSRVIFGDVEYGAMRQVYFYGIDTGAGSIDGGVFFLEDRLVGEIINNTPFDLRDCRLVSGKRSIGLGEIASGGTKKIEAMIMTGAGEPHGVVPQQAGPLESRMAGHLSKTGGSPGELIFLGFCDRPTEQFSVVRPAGRGQISGLTMVRQRIDLGFPGGSFRLPPGFIKSTVSSQKVIYDLPGTLNTADFTVTAIEVPPLPPGHTVEIYRADTNVWEQLDPGGGRFVGGEALKYLSGQGKIELRLFAPMEKTEGFFSGIAVEGVVGR